MVSQGWFRENMLHQRAKGVAPMSKGRGVPHKSKGRNRGGAKHGTSNATSGVPLRKTTF